MKTIGIIGGLGPETSSKFYLEVILKSYKQNITARPPILMWSVPIKYQIESDFINGKDRSDQYTNLLIDAAKRLEAGGADFIVIPCNSVHIFIQQVRNAVTIPVLSIIEETTAFLKQQHIQQVGLLATNASLQAGLYQAPLEREAITTVVPDNTDQAKMAELINKLVREEYSEAQKTELIEIISHLAEKEVNVILLACTDLQLLTPSYDGVTIFDTMEILVDSTVKTALS